jgi:WD40 repeat protein/transcriptional regulator with XRE-family HTH domain
MAEEPPYAAGRATGDGRGPGEGPAAVGERRDFAIQLTLLRERAGLTVRAVARILDARDATIGGYFGGAHLPSVNRLPELLAACGVTGPEAVREWTEALIRVRPRRGRTGGVAPYRGLASFEPEHSEWFFGREEPTALLRRRLAEREAAGQALIVAVGPSGSGKSSLLRAGLVPALLDEGRRVELLTPGPHPLTELAARLAADAPETVARTVAALSLDPGGCPGLVRQPVALVVDQFEETFTACLDETERQAFVTALCALAGGPAQVVLGLRADFYAEALRHPLLAAALQDAQVVVGPMTRAQLRRAIAEPALKAGLALPDGLVELVLSELAPPTGGAAREASDTAGAASAADTAQAARAAGAADAADAAHEAGALPLLSHALLATFRRSRDRRLTVSDYRESGGIAGAVAHTAEAICSELTAGQLDLTRRLFLRLVRVSEDSADTRRRVWRSEVLTPGAGDELADVVDRFIDQRLITAHADTLELTHEALLTAWPRLRAWIDADRTGIRVHSRLTEAAQIWHDAGGDRHALPRGGPLAMFRDWAADPSHRLDLNRLEREFLDAGIEHDRQEKLSARRRTLVLQGLVAALTVLAVLAGGLSVYAFREGEQARAQSAAAQRQRALAVSREVAIEADRARGGDVTLAAQLSLAAYRISPTPQARSSLLDSSAAPSATRLLGPKGGVQALALDSRTHVLVAGCADGTVWRWDATRAARPRVLGKPVTAFRTKKSGDALFGTAVFAVALSPDGRTLAAAGADRTVWLWDLARPAAPRALGKPLTGAGNTVYSLAFSPDGRTLAAGSADRTVRLWDVGDRERPSPIAPLRGAADFVEAVAFSPDGRTLAAGGADRTVRLWDLSHRDTPRALGKPLTGPAGVVDSLAFGPGGRTLAAAVRDGSVWRWNLSAPGGPAAGKPLTGATSWVNAVAFSPDGRTLAAGGSDDLVRLWDVDTGRVTATLPHPGPVTSLVWRDGTTLVSGDADAQTRLWHLPSPVLAADGVVNGVAFSPDGHLLAVAADRLRLWDTATRRPVGPSLGAPGAGVDAAAVAFSPDGRTLAVAFTDSRLRLWNIADPARPVPLGPPLSGPASGYVESVAYSRDGRTLATGNDDGTVRLWDVADVARPRALGKPLTGPKSYVFSVAFSPDGRTLAAGSADKTVRLWDLTDRAAPSALGKPITAAADSVYSVAFSPDGRTLAAGSADKKVRLWDLARRARPRALGRPLTGPGNYVYAIAFSPDGRTLAAASTDHTAWLWDVSRPAAPAVLATLTGPADHLYTVAFSPDGRTLAAGGADLTVRLWATDPASVGKRVCAVTGAALSRAEWHQYIQDSPYEPVCGG